MENLSQINFLDIQEYSITRSKLLLSLYAVSEGEDIERFDFNLHTGDALIFNWEEKIEDLKANTGEEKISKAIAKILKDKKNESNN